MFGLMFTLKQKILGGVILFILLGSVVAFACQENPVTKNSLSDKPLHSQNKNHIIQIVQFKFVPKSLTVTPGDTVTWINKDIVPHNLVDTNNKTTLSPILAKGESFSYEVKKKLDYFCGFHPSMQGILITE